MTDLFSPPPPYEDVGGGSGDPSPEPWTPFVALPAAVVAALIGVLDPAGSLSGVPHDLAPRWLQFAAYGQWPGSALALWGTGAAALATFQRRPTRYRPLAVVLAGLLAAFVLGLTVDVLCLVSMPSSAAVPVGPVVATHALQAVAALLVAIEWVRARRDYIERGDEPPA